MAEVLWRIDPAVAAARKMDGWREFHRICGLSRLYFDHPTKLRGQTYQFDAFTLDDRRSVLLARATGQGVIGAMEAAYRASGISVPEAEVWLDRLAGRNDADDFDSLL